MASQAIEGACAFAWRNYLLLHSGISENDTTRSAVYRYVSNLRDTGEYDFDHLQIAAVAYLKKLDELHDDQGARLAADQALAECLESPCTTRHLALGHSTRAKERNSMVDKTANANRFARDPQRRNTAATAIGMNALKPIMHFQVSMLRMWADSIERFAGNYEKGFEETATNVEEQSDKERAA
jgi:hypothetical protein